MIKLPNLEQLADHLGFPLTCAFAEPEGLVDGRQLQVRILAAVIEEVDEANPRPPPASGESSEKKTTRVGCDRTLDSSRSKLDRRTGLDIRRI